MPQSKQTAEQFIDAVHRRLVLLRAAEQVGRGMLLASALAILLVCIAIWQSMPTPPVLIFCTALGLLIGLAFAIYRWPSRMSAAIEADRQLQLHDLLTTSILLATSGDVFEHAVVAMADARCQSHSPSEVVLHQLGIRSWSGIGLAMSIAATLAAIPLGPSRTHAIDANISILSENQSPAQSANPIQQSHGPVARISDPTSENAFGNSTSTEQTAVDQAGARTGPAIPVAGQANGASGGDWNTATVSHANSQTARNVSHPEDETGNAAGGGSALDHHAGSGETDGGTRAGTHRPATPDVNVEGNSRTASPTFPTAAEDRVPPEDRDLVRDYFNKQ